MIAGTKEEVLPTGINMMKDAEVHLPKMMIIMMADAEAHLPGILEIMMTDAKVHLQKAVIIMTNIVKLQTAQERVLPRNQERQSERKRIIGIATKPLMAKMLSSKMRHSSKMPNDSAMNRIKRLESICKGNRCEGLGNRVVAAFTPGVAAANAAQRQPAALERAMALDGFHGVGRAAGMKPAAGRSP